MREYETIFVVRPDAAESQANQLLEKVNGLIASHKGEILRYQNMGKKELAYRIKKHKQGTYYYYNYTGDQDTVKEFERTLKLNELPLRYLTVKIADEIDVAKRKQELASVQPFDFYVATTTIRVRAPIEDREERDEEVERDA